ncbi:MAG: hypothetical protein ACLPYS_21045 [Vulcanimicrobiaceae bacterium]
MSEIKDALERARSETQGLHTRIEASSAKDHATLRADVEHVAAQAKKLAAH